MADVAQLPPNAKPDVEIEAAPLPPNWIVIGDAAALRVAKLQRRFVMSDATAAAIAELLYGRAA